MVGVVGRFIFGNLAHAAGVETPVLGVQRLAGGVLHVNLQVEHVGIAFNGVLSLLQGLEGVYLAHDEITHAAQQGHLAVVAQVGAVFVHGVVEQGRAVVGKTEHQRADAVLRVGVDAHIGALQFFAGAVDGLTNHFHAADAAADVAEVVLGNRLAFRVLADEAGDDCLLGGGDCRSRCGGGYCSCCRGGRCCCGVCRGGGCNRGCGSLGCLFLVAVVIPLQAQQGCAERYNKPSCFIHSCYLG